MPLTVQQAAEKLARGEIILFPTETVYGLGARFDDETAVMKIFEAKGRPQFNPLIVHVLQRDWVDALVTHVDGTSEKLIKAFWPGPLTLLLPKSNRVADLITAGLSSVAIRSPSHPIARELLEKLGKPIVAPSANLFTKLSATRFSDLDRELISKTAGAIDGGDCSVGVESTVVRVREDRVEILRSGGVTAEEISQVTGLPAHLSNDGVSASPGRLLQHYAPETPLVVCSIDAIPQDSTDIGILLFEPSPTPLRAKGILTLSSTGDLREAAHNLFAMIKQLDASNVRTIYAVPAPNQGLGVAINDRLERARHKV